MALKRSLPVLALLLPALLAQAEPEEFVPLSLYDPVEKLSMQEISFRLKDSGRNPFDPDEIAVDALFSAPSGAEARLPAFYFAPADAASREGEWRIRFTPVETGAYLVKVFLSRRREAPHEIATGIFRSTPSTRAGFVRAETGASPRFTIGAERPFFPVGANCCWGQAAEPDPFFDNMDRLAASGANCIRIWLAPWWLPIEKKLGVYDAGACARLDAILLRAEALGLRVILCIEQHGNFEPKGAQVGLWPSNPYNAALGGPCAGAEQFFTDARAARLFKNRLRYLVARWSYSPSIMAWELFNEVELIPMEGGVGAHRDDVKNWHAQMAGYLRANDPFGHLVFTSSDVLMQRELAAEHGVDAIQLHLYASGSISDRLMLEIPQLLDPPPGVPVLVGEFGPWEKAFEPREVSEGILTAALVGPGVSALPWLTDVKDPAPYFRQIAVANDFLAGTDWNQPHAFLTGRLAAGDAPGAPEIAAPVLRLGGEWLALLRKEGQPPGARKTQTWRLYIPGLPEGACEVQAWNLGNGAKTSRQLMNTPDGFPVPANLAETDAALRIIPSAARAR